VIDGTQLVAATNVTGDASGLSLEDQNGTAISNPTAIDIEQGGAVVAVGSYNYKLGTGAGNDGLYVGYGLFQLDLQTGKTLTLTEDAGATGNDADMAAKITGDGNLDIKANDTITLSNPGNDFTGHTTVDSGTLKGGAKDVVGKSNGLTVNAGGTFDMGGFDQVVNNLTGKGNVTNSAAGCNTLTSNNTGTTVFDGHMTGALGLTVATGTLSLTNSNTYTCATVVKNGATLDGQADNVFSPNSDVTVDKGGTLALNGNDQTVKSLNNGGTVKFGPGLQGGVFTPTTLTVSGNYVGTNGILQMNTVLGADNSPTDKLVVGGNVSGKIGRAHV
jgi:autotransporter-associated beta strand protein